MLHAIEAFMHAHPFLTALAIMAGVVEFPLITLAAIAITFTLIG